MVLAFQIVGGGWRTAADLNMVNTQNISEMGDAICQMPRERRRVYQ